MSQKPVKNNDDMKFLKSRYSGKIGDEHCVCCDIEPTITAPANMITIPPPAPTTTTASTKKNSPGLILPSAPVCGSYLGERIFGGNNTKIDEFPWAALMQYTYRNSHYFD